jgi:hypothetical protein
MAKAIDLLRQGRQEEIWQMCCGYLNLNIEQFIAVQKRLLLDQIKTLNRSKIGRKIMDGAWPQTVEEFRQEVPLTTYPAYCPELIEKKEDALPSRPSEWTHTSGKSGEYPYKWIPMTSSYIDELSPILYGIGLLSASTKWGDTTPFVKCPHFIYSVAPRPWISGSLANMLQEQTPLHFYPSLEQSEKLAFDERMRVAFEEALAGDLDYFFGLSLVLVAVGSKFSQSASQVDMRPLLPRPRAMMRLTRGMIKSRLAGRNLLPKDLWHLKGIICSGPESSVYKEKIKEYWGRYPLDIYACTEGGVIATQTWDYDAMTFIPNLNFLEFIPEKEHIKCQSDHSYRPRTVLLDEVRAGECYEIVITNFHGGVLTRYRVGDMIRISSLRNDNLGIEIPQMVFERRCDDQLDFTIFRLTEKTIWQAIENAGVPYTDWVAFKKPGEPVLNVLLELDAGVQISESDMEMIIYKQLLLADVDPYTTSSTRDDMADMLNFRLRLALLSRGTFARYTSQKQAEGADLAHLKPPHINPSEKVLATLLNTSRISLERIMGVAPKSPPVPIK